MPARKLFSPRIADWLFCNGNVEVQESKAVWRLSFAILAARPGPRDGAVQSPSVYLLTPHEQCPDHSAFVDLSRKQRSHPATSQGVKRYQRSLLFSLQ